jgi:uncharacterized protein (TIGR03083 family)
MTSTQTTAQPPAEDWAAHLSRETSRFAEVAGHSPLAAHVPAYPAFTVASLSAHIGRALRTFQALLSGSGQADPAIDVPAGPAVTGWVQAALDPLLAALAQAPPDQPVTFPHGNFQRPASAIAPLLAVEVGVHRWDVESVLGSHQPIPPDLAVREAESVFENFVPRLAASGVAPIGGTVRLQATDAPVSWEISVQDGRLLAGRAPEDPGEAAVVVSAPVEDLALIIWKRWPPPRPGVDVSGSAEVLKRFLSTDYIPDPRTTPEH